MSDALQKYTGDEMAMVPRTFAEAQQFAEALSRSRFIPDAFQNKPHDILACIIAGHELGIGPMQALRAIHVVKGKPVLSADLMVALVKRSEVCSYFRLVESTNTLATYETQRRGDPVPTSLTWTIENAKTAKLTGNPTWGNHPAAMLRARCSSALARAVYPDLVMGIYDEDEGVEVNGGKPIQRNDAPALPAADVIETDSETLPVRSANDDFTTAEFVVEQLTSPYTPEEEAERAELIATIERLGPLVHVEKWGELTATVGPLSARPTEKLRKSAMSLTAAYNRQQKPAATGGDDSHTIGGSAGDPTPAAAPSRAAAFMETLEEVGVAERVDDAYAREQAAAGNPLYIGANAPRKNTTKRATAKA